MWPLSLDQIDNGIEGTCLLLPTDLVYHICELYIDDVLIHGGDPATFLAREFKYVGHVISKPLSAAKKHLQLPETLLP